MSTGLEGFGGADMVVPTYKLFQATSSDVPGIDKELSVADIFDPTNKKNYGKELQVVLLAAKRTRLLYWDKQKDGKTGRRCWSDDGDKPAANVETPVNDRCDYCEFHKQDLQYELTLMDVKESVALGQPIVFRFIAKGTTRFPTQTLITSLIRSGKPARDFVITMKSLKQPNKQGKGSFATLNWERVIPVDNDSVPAEVSGLAEEAYQLYVGGIAPEDDALQQQAEEAAGTGTDGQF